MTSFRLPERLGSFSLWIAPEIYPLAEVARDAAAAHRALVRERVLQTLPGERLDLTQDAEFLASATGLFRRFEELWEGLEREQSLASLAEAPHVRRGFLASAVEWAMDLHYEVREAARVERDGRARWVVVGRAWDGDRHFDAAFESEAFPAHDRAAGERLLLECLTRCYCGAIGGVIGWSALATETAPAPASGRDL